MKQCTKCGEIKALSEFYKDRTRKDGLKCWCKACCSECQKAYQQTKTGREAKSRGCKRYFQTKRGKEAISRLNKKYRTLNPEKIKARQAVNSAIEAGTLIRPTTCSCCGVKCVPAGHHWSYAEEHWLDVIWLCMRCHRDIHAEINEVKIRGY